MTHDSRCPSCGHDNTADAAECTQCHFPLRETAAPARPEPASPPSGPATEEPPVEISMARIRPIRPRRPSSPQQVMQLQLWLILGALAVAAVLWTAWQGFQKNNSAQQPIAGAQEAQQQQADAARVVLARDSSNVNAQIALANILYDTANWPEAIIHYKSALRLDSTRVTTMVDLGVCYYNLSQTDDAEVLFKKAIKLDPNQPVALFNLGIVSENRGEMQKALDYYHGAMRAGAPEHMAESLNDALKRVMAKMGKTAPPIEGGPGGMPPAGMPGGGK
jgi:cytochrome c-type biogenesis protein CcmH/NrfG